jgi:hypothetical protein
VPSPIRPLHAQVWPSHTLGLFRGRYYFTNEVVIEKYQ